MKQGDAIPTQLPSKLGLPCTILVNSVPWSCGEHSTTCKKVHVNLCSTLCYSVQSPSRVRFFVTPWTAARQASLSITSSQSLLKLMSIELVMPSNHLNFCCPLLLLPSIIARIRVFYNESVLPIRWPKYWSFSFQINCSVILAPTDTESGVVKTSEAAKLLFAMRLGKTREYF